MVSDTRRFGALLVQSDTFILITIIMMNNIAIYLLIFINHKGCFHNIYLSIPYLVNFSSRLLTIISSSRILSSFSLLAPGDLRTVHKSCLMCRSNLTWRHRQR